MTNIAYLPITITNNQTTATGANFPQQIVIDSSTYSSYEASDLSNVYFSSDTAGSNIINSIGESGLTNSSTSTIYWVLLASSLAASGGSTTIYMQFATTSTNVKNSTTSGMAPTWATGTYGQYDNSTTIFTDYDNFSGTALNATKWGTVTNEGTFTATVNNGLTVTADTSSAGYIYVKSSYTAPVYIDCLCTYSSTGGAPNVGFGLTTTSTFTSSGNSAQGPPSNYQVFFDGTSAGGINYNSSNSTNTVASSNYTTGEVSSFAWISGPHEYWNQNYTNILSETDSTVTFASTLYGFLFSSNGAYTSALAVQWYRVRIVPPNNVMPAQTNGSIVVPRYYFTKKGGYL